ncbi:MAG: hypothetical protein H7843_01565 [Nitrospirota bacterium]
MSVKVKHNLGLRRVPPIIRKPKKSSVAGGQERIRRVGCIEAVYAVIFGYSCYLIASVFFEAIFTIIFHYESLYNNHIFHTSFSALVLLGILLQFLRMYFYLHLFDQKQEDKDHFIAQMSGKYKIRDVLFRFLAAATVIVSVKSDPSKLISYVEDICSRKKVGDVTVLIYFATAILALFIILFFWDLNLLLWRKYISNSKDYGLTKYHPNLKLWQRIFGIIFSVVFLITLFNINKCIESTAIAFIYAFSILPFMFLWGYEYVSRFIDYRVLNESTVSKQVITTVWYEFFSPVQTILDLIKYAIKSRQTE